MRKTVAYLVKSAEKSLSKLAKQKNAYFIDYGNSMFKTRNEFGYVFDKMNPEKLEGLKFDELYVEEET